MSYSFNNEVVRPGISSEFLALHKIRHVDNDEASTMLGFPVSSGGIAIPYYYFKSGTQVHVNGKPYWRVRLDQAIGDIKYFSPENSGSQLYVPSRPPFGGGDLVLCEGEFKALAPCEAGIRAVAIGGINSAMPGGKLLPALNDILKDYSIKRVLFLGDNDTAFNFNFSIEAVKLASAIGSDRRLLLPRIPLSMPKGIDDCKEALGNDKFLAFWAGLTETAIEVDHKLAAPALARMIAVRELPAIAGALQNQKTLLIDRLLALASRLVGSEFDLDALTQAAHTHLGINVRPFKSTAKAQANGRAAERSKARTEEDPRIKIEHPGAWRLDTQIYREVAAVIAPEYRWFMRGPKVVAVHQVQTGFVYASDSSEKFKTEAYAVGLREISALNAASYIEEFISPGHIDNKGIFVPSSFPRNFYPGLIHSLELEARLPRLLSVLTVPTPFLDGTKLIYPNRGYDQRFGSYLVLDAPLIEPMTLEEALQILRYIYYCFPFTSAQSRTNAIALLLTPFVRGIIGPTTRTPLGFYTANRPGTGKDYLAALPGILFDGVASEDQPILKDDAPETRKRIMSAARSGRRRMHFANCQDHLDDPALMQAITSESLSARELGSNSAAADITVPNTMDYSLSAQVGLTYREDYSSRMLVIEQAYYEEDFSERRFIKRDIHQYIMRHRCAIISALAALVQHWAEEGCPRADMITRFEAWSPVVGGIMQCAGLGNPCLPNMSKFSGVGGDLKERALAALFRICGIRSDDWMRIRDLYGIVEEAAWVTSYDDEPEEDLRWFGHLRGEDKDKNVHSNQTKFGILLRQSKGRVIGGVRLEIDESNSEHRRHRFRFVKAMP